MEIVNRVIMEGLNMNSLPVWGEIYNRLKTSFDGCFQWKRLSQQYKSLRELTLSIVF